MEDKDIPGLLYKYLLGTLEEEEQQRLEAWRAASPDNAYLMDEIASSDSLREGLSEYHPENRLALRDRILQKIPVGETVVRRATPLARRWWMAAAVLVLVASATAYVLLNPSSKRNDMAIAPAVAEIMPGKSGAILTLANGQQVVLDSLSEGVVTNQNGSQVVLEDGGLAYTPAGEASGEVAFNTITTPKGRQFDVKLPDGTRVWLNAASSITYPTAFTGKERMVKITGEAYLEVNKSQTPFRVQLKDETSIRVLGTHFNVNAYDNEASIRTTLLEGSVRVEAKEAVTLKPGQQADVNERKITVNSEVSVDKVMAWKNGLFDFEGATLEEVMRQLERWYDIDVVYEGKVQDVKLVGKMTRGVTLNGLLKGLNQMGINTRLEGRTLQLF